MADVTVPDAEVRREALRLFEIAKAAQDALQVAEDEYDLPDDAKAKALELEEKKSAAIEAILREHDIALEAVYKKNEPNLASMREACKAAEAAYLASEGPNLLETYDGNAVICAITGLPIWETDEVLEDVETSDVVLRSATGLPPRAIDTTEIDVEEAA